MTTSDRFDPYHKWFGIPPSQQPPTHYRLLGLEPFEPDREVIDAAANQRIAYLQDIAAGPHGNASQRLLNEVAAARRTLLNPKTKKAYDEQLQRSSAADPARPKDSEIAIDAAFAFDDDLPVLEPKDRSAPPKASNQRTQPRKAPPPKSRNWRDLLWMVGVAFGLVIATAAIIIAVMSANSKSQNDTPVVKAQPEAPPVKAQPAPPKKLARLDPVRADAEPPTNPMPQVGRPPVAGNNKWKIDGQELIVTAEDTILTFGPLNWTDYDFSCQARYEGANGAIALIVRSDAQCQNAYVAQFGIGNIGSSVFSVPIMRLDPIHKGDGGLKPQTWYKLTVKVRGNKIECLVDGKTVVEMTGDRHPAGRVGVGGGIGVRFTNVQVTDPDGKVLLEDLRGLPK
jgi:hypothetical protein